MTAGTTLPSRLRRKCVNILAPRYTRRSFIGTLPSPKRRATANQYFCTTSDPAAPRAILNLQRRSSAMQKQALGKGLGALIPDLSTLDDRGKKALGITEIELDKIIPNEYQPRKVFNDDKLKEQSY